MQTCYHICPPARDHFGLFMYLFVSSFVSKKPRQTIKSPASQEAKLLTSPRL